MKGADEYAKFFSTGQYGRLYIVSSSHARGPTFHVYVLPDGEAAKPNGPNNAPLNADAVEVYGILGGQPGWTEWYGWLHDGPWQRDFAELVASRQKEVAEYKDKLAKKRRELEEIEADRKSALLSTYH